MAYYMEELGVDLDLVGGDRVAWLIDPAAADPAQGRREILARNDGLVLSRRQRKYVAPNESVAKIVGKEALDHRQLGSLLEN